MDACSPCLRRGADVTIFAPRLGGPRLPPPVFDTQQWGGKWGAALAKTHRRALTADGASKQVSAPTAAITEPSRNKANPGDSTPAKPHLKLDTTRIRRLIRVLRARIWIMQRAAQKMTVEATLEALYSVLNRLRWVLLAGSVLALGLYRARNPAPQHATGVPYSTFLLALESGAVSTVALEPRGSRIRFNLASSALEEIISGTAGPDIQQAGSLPSYSTAGDAEHGRSMGQLASIPLSSQGEGGFARVERGHTSRTASTSGAGLEHLGRPLQEKQLTGTQLDPGTLAARSGGISSPGQEPSGKEPSQSDDPASLSTRRDLSATAAATQASARGTSDAAAVAFAASQPLFPHGWNPQHTCWRESLLGKLPLLHMLVAPCPPPAYQFACSRLLHDEAFLLSHLYAARTPFSVVPRPASERLQATLWEVALLALPLVPFTLLAMRTVSGRGGREWRPARDGRRRKARGPTVGFKDVAGVDVAKAELVELVHCLEAHDKGRGAMLGAHLPRGVLLVGPPGTGKTLLARALAEEAGVPFFAASGSEFVELFVGRGAARVRELFATARRAAPAVVFIDEIDAVGSARGRSNNDEREQTLNQLLTELDGFDTQDDGVLLLAATNRVDVLDPALCRAGRISRRVLVPLPDEAGRRDILALHMRAVPGFGEGPQGAFVREAVAAAVAAATPGFSGAELANVVNEAALLASREGLSEITLAHLQRAVERCRWGVGISQGTGPIAGLARWLENATRTRRPLLASG